MTGYDFPPADNGQAQSKPSFGSILARYRGPTSATTGLPTYVRLRNILGDGPAWLGAAYAPLDATGRARHNMNPQVTLEQLDERRSLLHAFDTANREVDRSGLMASLDSFETQAFQLLHSGARDAFDLSREEERTRRLYGPTNVGRPLLLARRLCEAGIGFVTISFGGWDMHGQVASGMRSLGPLLDQAVAGFIQDTHDRGLDRHILLVITGEFGRTPRINKVAGRDHWAPLSTLALIGGGLRMGQVVGESDARAEVPRTRPITPQDLMATIFHVLGIPRDLHYNDPSGRPMPMIDTGRVIHELV